MADGSELFDEDYYEGEDVDDEYEEGEEEDDEEYDTDDGEEEEEANEEDDREIAEEWQGRTSLPKATWESLTELVRQMSQAGKTELTVLLLGKPGVGRSSAANSLLCERAADFNSGVALTQGPRDVTIYVRSAGQFLLKVIDTPGLLLGDKVNARALEQIAASAGSRQIDAVLFVERLDLYRIEPIDRQLLRAITQHYGRAIWKRTIIAFTRGTLTPPAGCEYAEFVSRRTSMLQQAIKQAGGPGDVPAVVMENSSRCASNSDGEKTLPDGSVWMTAMWERVVEMALSPGRPFSLSFKPYNPNRRRLWLIPVLLLVQYAAKRFVLDRVIEEDGWRGDRHGDFDPETQREEKALALTRKAEAKRQEERQRKLDEQNRAAEQRRAASLASQASSSAFRGVTYEDDDADDDEDYE